MVVVLGYYFVIFLTQNNNQFPKKTEPVKLIEYANACYSEDNKIDYHFNLHIR